jgi:hypothetical protein
MKLMSDSDHFDQKVEASLRRDIPIITTPHAQTQLTNKGNESFTNVSALAPFETGLVDIGGTGGPKRPLLRITGMPGKHVPSNAVVGLLNKMANAVRTTLLKQPTNDPLEDTLTLLTLFPFLLSRSPQRQASSSNSAPAPTPTTPPNSPPATAST